MQEPERRFLQEVLGQLRLLNQRVRLRLKETLRQREEVLGIRHDIYLRLRRPVDLREGGPALSEGKGGAKGGNK